MSDKMTRFEEYSSEKDWTRETAMWARAKALRWFDWLGKMTLESVKVGDFNRFMSQLRKDGWSWSLRNGTYTVIAAFWHWLFINNRLDDNFFTGDHKPKRPRKETRIVRPVAKAHIMAMLRYLEISDTPENRRNKAIIHLMASTGVRRMEVVGLTLSELDFEQGIMVVKGKFGNERIGFISESLGIALKHWLRARPHTEHDYVFMSLHHAKNGIYKPLRPDAINKIIDAVKRDAGIGKQIKITPHMFRHFFASEASKAENPFALMKLLGHSDIKTTEIYVTVQESELRRVAGKVKL